MISNVKNYEFDYLDLIGRPWSPEFDCYALVVEVYRRMGITLPDGFNHSVTAPADIHHQVEEGKRQFVELVRPAPFCIVALRPRHPSYVSHVGVMLDTVRFLHVQKKTAACVERIDSPLWAGKIAGFYQYAPL